MLKGTKFQAVEVQLENKERKDESHSLINAQDIIRNSLDKPSPLDEGSSSNLLGNALTTSLVDQKYGVSGLLKGDLRVSEAGRATGEGQVFSYEERERVDSQEDNKSYVSMQFVDISEADGTLAPTANVKAQDRALDQPINVSEMHSEGTGANEGVRDFAFGGRSTVMSAGGLVLESMMSSEEARRNH